jgi:hypothetical protein
VAGTHAWIGSANASSTHPNPDAVDWSLTTPDARVVRGLRARFNQHWRASSVLPAMETGRANERFAS